MVCLRLGLEAAASTEATAAAADVVDVVVAAAAAAVEVAAACRLEDAELSLESATSDQMDVLEQLEVFSTPATTSVIVVFYD